MPTCARLCPWQRSRGAWALSLQGIPKWGDRLLGLHGKKNDLEGQIRAGLHRAQNQPASFTL